MENVRELPAESLDAILSGPALQELARRTAIHTLARLRKEASAEIARLIDFLDASDPYVTTELEEQVDDGPIDEDELEPSFCGVTAGDRAPNLAGTGGDELEADYGHGQDANDEPSLGSVAIGEHVTQAQWAQGGTDDTEDEHDGAEPDEADYEPSIGFDPCTIIAEDDTADREPSLGWTLDGCTGGTTEPDLEEGEPARAPQGRTELDGIGLSGDLCWRPALSKLTGLSQRQRKLLNQRRRTRGTVGLCD